MKHLKTKAEKRELAQQKARQRMLSLSDQLRRPRRRASKKLLRVVKK